MQHGGRAWARVAISAALLLAVVLVYLPVRQHGFIGFDDRSFLVENRALDSGLSGPGLRWALTATTDGNWIPATWISFLADQELHGLTAAGTHTTNVLLHGLAAVLLLLALARMSGALWPSAFVAALFALHPLRVESVAWAIERKDVLSGACFAATLLAYSAYARRPGPVRWLAVFGLFALGLLSKPMLVTLPGVLLLLDAWPLGRLRGRAAVRGAVVEKLPFLALSLAVGIVTIRIQAGAGELNLGEDLPLGWRLANAVVSTVAYLRKAVWPLDLAVFYPHPGTSLSALRIAGSLGLVLAISVACALQWRRRPWLGVGWLWYLGTLAPVVGLLQVGLQAMADRYTYIPLIGPAIAVGWAGAELAARGRVARIATVALAACALVACVGLTRRQLAFWTDTPAVFARAIAVSERNAVAENGLGSALLDLGRDEQARTHFERALAIDPDFVDAHVNLGIALVRTGEPAAALPHLRRGLALPPERRWRVHAQLGLAHLASARPADALAHGRAGLALRPGDPALELVAADALLALSRPQESERALARARAAGADPAQVDVRLAQVRASTGRPREAAALYRRVLAARPEDFVVMNNLAWLLATSSDAAVRSPAEAVRLAETAVAAAGGDDPDLLDTLAVACHEAGQLERSIAVSRRMARAARARGNERLAREAEARAAQWAEP